MQNPISADRMVKSLESNNDKTDFQAAALKYCDLFMSEAGVKGKVLHQDQNPFCCNFSRDSDLKLTVEFHLSEMSVPL